MVQVNMTSLIEEGQCDQPSASCVGQTTQWTWSWNDRQVGRAACNEGQSNCTSCRWASVSPSI